MNETENDAAHFLLDMHQNLGDPIEQLGMEIEQDDNETVTDFKTRFGEKLLWNSGVNVTALEEGDLRCGGLVLQTNMSGINNLKLSELAADCMVQECQFRQGGPDICPPDYIESDDTVFWMYFFLRFLATTMLSAGKLLVGKKNYSVLLLLCCLYNNSNRFVYSRRCHHHGPHCLDNDRKVWR